MRTLVAILALSPALLHAQAKAPAQPVSTPVLLVASSPHTSAPDAPAHTRPISTGVTPARLIHSVPVVAETDAELHRFPGPRTVVIQMTVDAAGKPADLHLVRASDPITGRDVLNAVSLFRYSPATVSGVATPQAVNLEVDLTND